MDNDDLPIGRILSRREVLALLGSAGAAALVVACGGGDGDDATATSTSTPTSGSAGTGTATAAGTGTQAGSSATQQATATTPANTVVPNCVVTPELTEGPYFVDEMLERSDIRADPGTGAVSKGTALALGFRVFEVNGNTCAPIEGAMVDVWHCDAAGVYSDASDPGFNTSGQKFLRGFQNTDQSGAVKFTTVYPGWYQGRAVHIHFKVRGTNASGQDYEFTSQLFFNEDTTDIVHAEQPYAAKGKRTLLNEGDGIFRSSGGQTLLEVERDGSGWAGTFDLGVQL